MNFEENIRKWVTIDNKLKEYATHIKSLREQKNQLSNTIIAHAVDQNLSHNTVEITDGVLKFQNIKVTAPLNFKFMTKCLNECISDEEQVKLLVSYIKQKREVKYVPEIKRTYAK
jgi:flagellar basal body rod protein FlgB